jgi:zinc D-Ala-D-Ala carboxypeptidase
MNDIQLSPHFKLSEFTASATANKLKIDNSPNKTQLANLKKLAKALEKVRSILGDKPIKITSGFRSAKLNDKTKGSSKTSAHSYGLAADFTCVSFGNATAIVAKLQAEGVVCDQIIDEKDIGHWVHFSPFYHDGQTRRNQYLRMRKVNGIPHYSDFKE